MPNCIQHIQENGEAANRQEIDDKICRQLFNREPSQKYWNGAFEYVEFHLAMGMSYDEILNDEHATDNAKKVVRFMRDVMKLTPSAWAER